MAEGRFARILRWLQEHWGWALGGIVAAAAGWYLLRGGSKSSAQQPTTISFPPTSGGGGGGGDTGGTTTSPTTTTTGTTALPFDVTAIQQALNGLLATNPLYAPYLALLNAENQVNAMVQNGLTPSQADYAAVTAAQNALNNALNPTPIKIPPIEPPPVPPAAPPTYNLPTITDAMVTAATSDVINAINAGKGSGQAVWTALVGARTGISDQNALNYLYQQSESFTSQTGQRSNSTQWNTWLHDYFNQINQGGGANGTVHAQAAYRKLATTSTATKIG